MTIYQLQFYRLFQPKRNETDILTVQNDNIIQLMTFNEDLLTKEYHIYGYSWDNKS